MFLLAYVCICASHCVYVYMCTVYVSIHMYVEAEAWHAGCRVSGVYWLMPGAETQNIEHSKP